MATPPISSRIRFVSTSRTPSHYVYETLDNLIIPKRSGGLDTFHRFLDLPVELRLKIWRLAALEPDPRIFYLINIKNDRHVDSMLRAPRMILTNRECHDEVLRSWKAKGMFEGDIIHPRNRQDLASDLYHVPSLAGFRPSIDKLFMCREEFIVSRATRETVHWADLLGHIQREIKQPISVIQTDYAFWQLPTITAISNTKEIYLVSVYGHGFGVDRVVEVNPKSNPLLIFPHKQNKYICQYITNLVARSALVNEKVPIIKVIPWRDFPSDYLDLLSDILSRRGLAPNELEILSDLVSRRDLTSRDVADRNLSWIAEASRDCTRRDVGDKNLNRIAEAGDDDSYDWIKRKFLAWVPYLGR